MEELRARLGGSIVPLVTPFRGGQVDEEAYARLVERVLGAGSQGVLVTGTTGEPVSLQPQERRRLLRVARRTAGSQGLVLAGVGTPNLEDTLSLARMAAEEGAEAVLVVGPFYHRPRPEGLWEYYREVVRSSPLPVLVYNIPARQGYSIAADVVIRLVESYPDRVLGMKESSWDVVQLSRLRGRLGEDFRLFTGTGNLALAAAALGLAGVISLAANVLPGEVARQWSLCQKGRWEEARALHLRLTDLNEILTEDSPMMVKVALELMGILSAEPRLPMTRPHPADVERLRQALEQAGILPLVDRAAGS